MHEPDIPQLEVQKSMARIREATSKTQEAPAKILNKELVKDLPAEFKIKLFPFRFFLDKSLIFSTSFRQILDTFRRNISLDQLSISTKRYIRPVVLFDQMSYSTKCLSTNCRGSSDTPPPKIIKNYQAYIQCRSTLVRKRSAI